MEEEKLLPNWITYLLGIIGIFSLGKFFSSRDMITINLIIALSYPVFLYGLLMIAKYTRDFQNGRYFKNVSVCFITFFLFILFGDAESLIKYIKYFIAGGAYSNRLLEYEEYYSIAANVIYIVLLLYFGFTSYILSEAGKNIIDKRQEN